MESFLALEKAHSNRDQIDEFRGAIALVNVYKHETLAKLQILRTKILCDNTDGVFSS